jgi:hypothetical protein
MLSRANANAVPDGLGHIVTNLVPEEHMESIVSKNVNVKMEPDAIE